MDAEDGDDLYGDLDTAADRPRAAAEPVQLDTLPAVGNNEAEAPAASGAEEAVAGEEDAAPPAEQAQPVEAAGAAATPEAMEELTAEEALRKISVLLKIEGQPPAAVVKAVQADRERQREWQQQLDTETKQHLARQVQIANLEAESRLMREHMETAQASQVKEVAQARKLFCDPAVAREFSVLNETSKNLRIDLKRAKDEIQALQFKPNDLKGKAVMNRLTQLQEENKAALLRMQDEAQVQMQLRLQTAQAKDLAVAYEQLTAETDAMEAQMEDIVTHIASVEKIRAELNSQPAPPPANNTKRLESRDRQPAFAFQTRRTFPQDRAGGRFMERRDWKGPPHGPYRQPTAGAFRGGDGPGPGTFRKRMYPDNRGMDRPPMDRPGEHRHRQDVRRNEGRWHSNDGFAPDVRRRIMPQRNGPGFGPPGGGRNYNY